MATHEVECINPFFSDVKSGKKNFEVRLNDRNYQVGDVIKLMEFDVNSCSYSGRIVYRQVMYILTGFNDVLAPNYIVMALSKVSKKRVVTA